MKYSLNIYRINTKYTQNIYPLWIFRGNLLNIHWKRWKFSVYTLKTWIYTEKTRWIFFFHWIFNAKTTLFLKFLQCKFSEKNNKNSNEYFFLTKYSLVPKNYFLGLYIGYLVRICNENQMKKKFTVFSSCKTKTKMEFSLYLQ